MCLIACLQRSDLQRKEPVEKPFGENAVLIDGLDALMVLKAAVGEHIMPRNGGSVELARAIDGLVQSGSLVGLSEDQLLARFVERQDPRAFEAIVNRHGPLVLTVCRQLLADPNDVDDAFQATFLVLIRKASSVRCSGSLASWLYGVAHRTALRLMQTSRPIRLLTDHVEAGASCPTLEREQTRLLHEEIDRLPEKYRQPIVLCYFEGLTHDDAATRLRWPVGTVRGRLARARDRLRDRLDRRGVSLSSALPGAFDRVHGASAVLPESLLRSTATLLEHNVSLRVSSIVQGVILTMLVNKLKWTLLALTTSSFLLVAAGAGLRAIASQAEKNAAADNFQRKREVSEPLDPVKTEELADRLELHRVDAELLEIKTQSLKSLLQRDIQRLRDWRSPQPGEMGPGGTPEERLKMIEGDRRMVDELKMRTDDMFKEYREDRLQLARLKRQIARESKALDQPSIDTDPASLSRRIETLESKVDQVLQILSKSPR